MVRILIRLGIETDNFDNAEIIKFIEDSLKKDGIKLEKIDLEIMPEYKTLEESA